MQVLQLTKPWQHMAEPHGACLEQGWTETLAEAWQCSLPLPVAGSFATTDARCPQAQVYAAGCAPKSRLGHSQVEAAVLILEAGGSCFCSPRLG